MELPPQAEVARDGLVAGAEMTTGITLGIEALVGGTTEEGDIDIGLQISFIIFIPGNLVVK